MVNVRGQIKAEGSLSKPFNSNGLTQGDALKKGIRGADVNARDTILFESTQLLASAHDIDIMERIRNIQSVFI